MNGAGFFYALQTLRQLLPINFTSNNLQKGTRWVLPVVKISDRPRFGWRGFMLDVSRHFYGKKYIYEILDQMAALKLNTFHWHLTDDQGWRIEIKKYPKLTGVGAWRVDYNDHDENHNRWWGRPTQKPEEEATYGGFYTQAEIRDIIKYAEERFITIVPELDMPGHSQATIAPYPEIACHPGPYYVATGGRGFAPLGEKSLLENAKVQGRYIHRAKIDLPKTKLKVLKIKLKTVNPIYEGHHRQGKQSRVFMDEIIVL